MLTGLFGIDSGLFGIDSVIFGLAIHWLDCEPVCCSTTTSNTRQLALFSAQCSALPAPIQSRQSLQQHKATSVQGRNLSVLRAAALPMSVCVSVQHCDVCGEGDFAP